MAFATMRPHDKQSIGASIGNTGPFSERSALFADRVKRAFEAEIMANQHTLVPMAEFAIQIRECCRTSQAISFDQPCDTDAACNLRVKKGSVRIR